MAAPTYIVWNADTSVLNTAPMSGTATSATANTPKTILQLKTGTQKIRVIEWGYNLLSTPISPLQIELIETGTVFATVTSIGSGIRPYSDVTGSTSLCPVGTTMTGFNCISGEGTITASRLLAQTYDTAQYFKQQYPLGREPEIAANSCLRIRATPTNASATTLQAYLIWEE